MSMSQVAGCSRIANGRVWQRAAADLGYHQSATEEETLATQIYDGCIFTGELLVLLVRVIVTWAHCLYLFFVPPEPKDVSGDIVLITGAGHGIGRELALRFGKLGAKVVCIDLNPKGNEETAKMVKETNGSAYHYQCDVTDREAVFSTAARIRKDVGEVTILVNNAGIMPCRPLLDHTEKEVRSVIDVNVTGNIWTLQAFLPPMLERNRGHVVALSSMAGVMGLRNLVPYCGTKWAVRGIMEALKIELHEDERCLDGINFTTICPIMVNTGLCHKPRIKRPKLMKVVEPDDAADQIMDAIRRNYLEITITSDLYYSNKLYRFIPFPVAMLFNDFFSTGVDAHD